MALVGVKQLSKIMKLTPRRIQQLVGEGLPKSERGKYNAETCLAWYIDYLKKEASGGSDGSDYKKALAEKLYWQAKTLKLQYERLAGVFIPTEAAMKAWEAVVKSVRQKLLVIPTKLAPLLLPCKSIAEIKDRLETGIHETLNELVNPELK